MSPWPYEPTSIEDERDEMEDCRPAYRVGLQSMWPALALSVALWIVIGIIVVVLVW